MRATENAYRLFWLAAVCTRWPNLPVENFAKIEAYLCEKFNIPDSVVIDGTAVTRNEYVDAVKEWKLKENLRLRARGVTYDRYTITEADDKQRSFQKK